MWIKTGPIKIGTEPKNLNGIIRFSRALIVISQARDSVPRDPRVFERISWDSSVSHTEGSEGAFSSSLFTHTQKKKKGKRENSNLISMADPSIQQSKQKLNC